MSSYRKGLLVFLVCLSVLIITTVSTCKKGLYEPGENDTIYLSVIPSTMPAGGSAIITIRGVKSDGRPMPDETLVRINADSGIFKDATGNVVSAALLKDGKAQLTYVSEVTFSGESVTITAQCGSAVTDPEVLSITIKDVDITQLFLSADPTEIAVGDTTTVITVTAVNDDSDPVQGKKLWLETTSGILTLQTGYEDSKTDTNGELKAILETDASATVTATYKGVTGTIAVSVGSNAAPTAAFAFSPQAPRSGDTIYFNADASTDADGQITDYSWDFGNGKTGSYGVTPTTSYSVTEETVFVVTLTVTDNNGGKGVISQEVTVLPKESQGPEAGFTFTPESPLSGETVTFTSTSKGEGVAIATYEWDFGDGGTSNVQDPYHIFIVEEETILEVTLTVTDELGVADSTSQLITVGIAELTSAFDFSPRNPLTGQEVHFTNESTSSGKPTFNYLWDFGDGSATTTDENPAHTYSTEGDYIVRLTVTATFSSGTQVTDTSKQTVSVTAGNQLPVASFVATADDFKVGERVNFDASASTDSDGYIVKYVWDFGDGNNSIDETSNHGHRYTTAGTYTVTLVVIDEDNGSSEPVTQTIAITD